MPPPPHSLPLRPSSVPQVGGTRGTSFGRRRTSTGQSRADAQRGLSERPPSQSAGFGPALAPPRGPQLPLIKRALHPSLPGSSGRRLWTGGEGRRRCRQLSSLLPPHPCGWAAGHEISSRRWGEGVTIQSTCHPHSQAASSSQLTNEGGGVGEADAGGAAQGDRHTDAGKETGEAAPAKAGPSGVHGGGQGRAEETERFGRSDRRGAPTPGHVA